jgi:predicted unusual protein kinase regulating ubiquinone biosynthesis (AarF/ABC1/UbiB family)
MGPDWEKLSGEEGRDVTSGRFKRLLRVGALGASVGASTALRKVSKAVRPGRREADSADGVFRSRQAEKVLKVLGEMKGATMKVGQILSSDPDLIPPEFVEKLTELQRDAPPMTYRTVQEIIEAAFDTPLSDIFETFEPKPVGSASIGQVHHARLRTGEEVAVKVQYPGICDTLESDLRNLTSLLTLARVVADRERVEAYNHEVRAALEQEMDYEGEASRLAHFHSVFSHLPGVTCPKPYPEWTKKNVLTMSFVHGAKLDDALEAMERGPGRDVILTRWCELYSWMLHELHELHADPHPGNFILTADNQLAVLDFGCVKRCDPRAADGILDILDACWQGDDARITTIYKQLGFGRTGCDESVFDPTLLRAYHELCLAPFMRDEPFDFGQWEMRRAMQGFMLENPAVIKLVPPAEFLLMFRVLGGIKGLLNKLDARINVHRMAVDLARRRGRLSAEPFASERP